MASIRYAHRMHISIVGAGYVGLVTAACLAHLGHDVICLDVDAARVAGLRVGRLPLHEPGLDGLVIEGLANGRLRFETDRASLRSTALTIVCVGTLDQHEEWDPSTVRAAVLTLAADETLPRAIVIRSTLLPGAAVRIAHEARQLDPRVRVAHNPEFTREAVAVSDFLAPDRVVIGVDDRDEREAAALVAALRVVYAPLDAPIVVTDVTSAEMIKVASNVFLAAKVTFANEIARLAAATGADAQAVVDGMGLDKRIGRSFLSPGPGFGGSCFPSQARALPQLARDHDIATPLMDAIWPSNERQSDWLVDRLERSIGAPLAGRRVALLGVTFKAGTDDLRESPALRLGRALLGRGAELAVYDPAAGDAGASRLRLSGDGASTRVSSAATVADACHGADAVVIATEWPEFASLDWAANARVMDGRIVVDTRNIVSREVAGAAGLRILALGVERVAAQSDVYASLDPRQSLSHAIAAAAGRSINQD
jgi:UDPglucose 6-dehydrogenase